MLRLYDFQDSGNGYKVRLLLNELGTRALGYPEVRAWLDRVRERPGHVPISHT